MVLRRSLRRIALTLDVLIVLGPLDATSSDDPVASLLRKFPGPPDWKFECYAEMVRWESIKAREVML
jgi:hypothetical protein